MQPARGTVSREQRCRVATIAGSWTAVGGKKMHDKAEHMRNPRGSVSAYFTRKIGEHVKDTRQAQDRTATFSLAGEAPKLTPPKEADRTGTVSKDSAIVPGIRGINSVRTTATCTWIRHGFMQRPDSKVRPARTETGEGIGRQNGVLPQHLNPFNTDPVAGGGYRRRGRHVFRRSHPGGRRGRRRIRHCRSST